MYRTYIGVWAYVDENGVNNLHVQEYDGRPSVQDVKEDAFMVSESITTAFDDFVKEVGRKGSEVRIIKIGTSVDY